MARIYLSLITSEGVRPTNDLQRIEDASSQKGLYVMGNKEILFDPFPCFSSEGAKPVVSIALMMLEAGYPEDIYVLPAAKELQDIYSKATIVEVMHLSLRYFINHDGYADWERLKCY